MTFRFLFVCVFFACTLCAQDNRFAEWPFLRNICTVDTACEKYLPLHVSTVTDSTFVGDKIVRIETRKYDAQGHLQTTATWLNDSTSGIVNFVSYGTDKNARVIRASIFEIAGKDTVPKHTWDILKYDAIYRPLLQHYHIYKKPGEFPSKKQFTDDRIIFNYSGTAASTHWDTDYGTDFYIRSYYDRPGYGWVQDMVHLHDKDTLYEMINYFDKAYRFVRSETMIRTSDSVRTKTVMDSLRNVTETKTWTRGKLTEHHAYRNEILPGDQLRTTIVNLLAVPEKTEYTVETGKTETVVKPANGEAIHIPNAPDEALPPPPAPPYYPDIRFTYSMKKSENGLTRYDYYNFSFTTSPLLTKWYDEKGLLVKYYSGASTAMTRRSYTFR